MSRDAMDKLTDALADLVEREAKRLSSEKGIGLSEAADEVLRAMAAKARERMAMRAIGN